MPLAENEQGQGVPQRQVRQQETARLVNPVRERGILGVAEGFCDGGIRPGSWGQSLGIVSLKSCDEIVTGKRRL